jgi:16S rRNA (guanine527-N7)-methyltransferase
MSPVPEEPLGPERFRDLLASDPATEDLALPSPAIDRLARYLAELDSWRRRVNLTGRLSGDELVGHAAESLLGSRLIAEGERLIDVGSGQGFPGLPLAIGRPDLTVTLAEPRAKRAAFLRHVLRELALSNATVWERRAEEVEEGFDVATARAVGGLAASIARRPFVRTGGQLLAWTVAAPGLESAIPGFRLGRMVPIPASRRRVIAEFLRS